MANRSSARRRRRSAAPGLLVLLGLLLVAYVVYPWLCRRSATPAEASATLPGDALVRAPETGYTLAVTIEADRSDVWPWLLQMGQGRGGFYTHESVENLLGAKIHNANAILAEHQDLGLGDSIRLTPDPYLGGQPGQYIAVAELSAPAALVFRQRLPNGSPGSWAFVLREANGHTRLLFRRRAGAPSAFDRVMLPGYYLMDRGMLAGLKSRVERNSMTDREARRSQVLIGGPGGLAPAARPAP